MRFFQLTKDEEYDSVEYSNSVDWESIKCPTHDGHQRAGGRIGDLNVKIQGAVDREFFWTFLSELVVSENFVDLLREKGFTGFETKPAKIINKKSDIDFFEFVVTGRSLADNIYLFYRCNDCGLEYYKEADQSMDQKALDYNKLLVNLNSWDGSDIFTVVGAGRTILVTERVAQLIISSKLKGSTLTEAENFDVRIY